MLLGPVDTTENNPNTYTSSWIVAFAWTDDPAGTRGLLCMRTKDGEEYFYEDQPESVYEELYEAAHYPEQQSRTVGQIFNAIAEENDSNDEYANFSDVLDN